MHFKVIKITSDKEKYIEKKLEMIKDFRIKLKKKDKEKLNACNSEIEVDQICRRIIMEGLG